MSELPENTTQPEAQETVVSPQAIKPVAKGYNKLALGVFFLIVGALGALGVYRLTAATVGNQNKSPQKIVVLDTQTIIKAATRQITEDKSLSIEQVGEVSKKLADNLKKVVVSYHDQGYIVFNGTALVTWPESVDITKTTADQLGVKL